MRIISGKLKGKKISFLKSSTTRPLKDSVKESIFNIISHSNLLDIDLKSSNVLDLYSGIGSFGLECISRGAKNIIFVEKDKKASEILISNLFKLEINSSANVIVDEVKNFLKKKNSRKFEIFFFDPPFKDSNFIQDLDLIKQQKCFKKEHVVIIHRERKAVDNLKGILDPIITKHYGRSKIIIGKFLL